MSKKTLTNTTAKHAEDQVKDVESWGMKNVFRLISKASSPAEGWMKSTKAMQIDSVGCVVQVTTQQGERVAEAVCFVPGVEIAEQRRGSEGSEDTKVISRWFVPIRSSNAGRPQPDLDAQFTYHAPTPEQAPKYAAIRQAEQVVADIIDGFDAEHPHANDIGGTKFYSAVNEATHGFAKAVLEHCPPSADASASIRCIRLVRNALNEFLAMQARGVYAGRVLAIAGDELYKARWSASSAIALEGK